MDNSQFHLLFEPLFLFFYFFEKTKEKTAQKGRFRKIVSILKTQALSTLISMGDRNYWISEYQQVSITKALHQNLTQAVLYHF